LLADIVWSRMFEMPQIAVVMGCMIPIVGVITVFWFRVQKVRAETELKRQLVERGLSADEIERIVTATALHEGDK